MKFKKINPTDISTNVFKLIGSEWMLITAGDLNSFNTMTASWGGFGVLWHKNICTIFVRPHRYTFSFLEKNPVFTLSFFSEQYKDAITICGTKSGRDSNKVAEAGLTPAPSENNGVYFTEASLVIECKKLYFLDIDPKNFLDPAIEEIYPQKDYHRMYIGEILSSLLNEKR
jgi:flavin reductase (DIM6/NTAB) family NADH-FMN oxidoreductase RutF